MTSRVQTQGAKGDGPVNSRVRVVRGLMAVLVGAGALALPAAATAAPGEPRFTAGAAGAGDAYFPFAGNGGYDVEHYDLDITYTPPASAPAPTRRSAEWRRDHRASWPRRTWTASTSTCAAWTCRQSRSTARPPAR